MLLRIWATLSRECMRVTTDFLGEDRHEVVAKLAYQHWEARGRPLGSAEVDWLAAERDLYESLVASGLVSPSAGNQEQMEAEIYRESCPFEKPAPRLSG